MSDKNKKNIILSNNKKALLEKLRRQKRTAAGSDSPASEGGQPGFPRRADSSRAPLSFAQERLWFLDRFDPGQPVYNIAVQVHLSGPLDARVLEKSISALVQRHEILRTVFPEENGQPLQRILPPASFDLPLTDLSHLPEPEKTQRADQQTRAQARTRFDLQRGPLFAAVLLRLDSHSHLFLLTMHHIISDAGAFAIFFRELSRVYAALAEGHPPQLPALPVQFGDYAAAEKALARTAAFATRLDFWQKKLTGAPAVLNLPTDHPRPVRQTYPGAQEIAGIPAELSAKIREFAAQENATPFMVLLAAYLVLLHRYSGQTDLTVGSTIANRNRPETQQLMGFFQNTLVLRQQFSPQISFREFLRQVRQTVLEAFDHQEVPFEKLVETLQPERHLNMNPLFQTAFLYQDLPVGESWRQTLQLPGITARPEVIHNKTAKFDLTLGIEARGGRFEMALEYNTDLFAAGTIRRMTGHYLTLLQGITANPGQPLAELPLLSDAEKQQILLEWNQTAREFPRERGFFEQFEILAEQNPGAVALIFIEDENQPASWKEITYEILNARANQLAHYLRNRCGVRPETPVGILLDRSPEMLVALLGVLKAGGAYVPLDPAFPEGRLKFMLKDSGAQVLLTHSGVIRRLPEFERDSARPGGPRRIDLGCDRAAIDRESTHNPAKSGGAENLAYLIYTSGSTGQPRGVEIPHRALTNLLWAMRRSPGMNPGDSLLSVTTLSFDIAALELFLPLIAGGRVILSSADIARNGVRLCKLLETVRPEIMQATPATWQMLLEAGWQTRLPLKMLCGGEALPPALAGELLKRGESLWNMYGPTETTIWSAVKKIEAANDVAIGPPIANTQFYLLDASGQPLPVGVPGELYIGGEGLARGYHNRPELTAERFVEHSIPHATRISKREPHNTPVIRLYRTGDLVRWLPNGELEFLGRLDHQVKIRGFRIELGEIEQALRAFPQITGAVVVARADESGEKYLAAYLTHEGEDTPDVAKLRNFLADNLPSYMIPAHFLVLEKFPQTPNGKVDRRALPNPQIAPVAVEKNGRDAPQNAREEILAGIWAEVLHLETVGREQNFFELGGHSLKVIQVISRVREALGVELAVPEVFAAPTLAGLAAKISARQKEGAARALPAEKPPRPTPLPLAFAQQRLWFLDQLEPQNVAYNVPAAIRLQGRCDAEALQKALTQVAQRHEILRGHFPTQNDRPCLAISDDSPVLTMLDLRGAPDPESAALTRLQELAFQPFDLHSGPLLRTWLLKTGEDTHILLAVMHHIISDGASLEIFFREIAECYRAELAGTAPTLPVLGWQYSDFACWQHTILNRGDLDAQLQYWQQQLRGLPVLQLPTDFPHPPEQDYRGGQESLVLSPDLTRALKKLSRAENVTLFMTLLTAFQTLLHRYGGQEDIAIGSPVNGRNLAALEPLIGFFANTLVLRGDLSGEPSFRELLHRTRTVCLDGLANPDVPFEKLVEALHPERDMSRNPLFQAMFVFQNEPWQSPEFHGLTAAPLEIAGQTAKFDLSLAAVEVEGALRLYLEYRRDIFRPETIGRMLQNLQTLLAGIAADPARPISRLPLLSAEEQRLVLEEWQQTAMDFPRQKCIHDLFAEQAAAAPGRVALLYGKREISYRELNERANRLAHYLMELGVRPENPVGVCLRRTPEMIVALLGILKAGGAYVPLDPAYPAERLDFMLRDCAAGVLISETPLLDQLPDPGCPIVWVDRDAAAMARQPGENPRCAVSAENLAYVIYTSGSTGTPKGVAICHRNTVALLYWAKTVFPAEELAGVLASTSICFDLSVFEIFVPLSWGGMVILGEDALAFPTLPGKSRVRLLNTVPSAARELLRQGAISASIRTVNLAGEPLKAGLVDLLYDAGVQRVFDLYGPSEDTTYSTFARRQRGGIETIGKPIANTQAYLLDRYRQPVPIGVAGELYLGGEGVARGYLNRPELTAERFVKHSIPRATPNPQHDSRTTPPGLCGLREPQPPAPQPAECTPPVMRLYRTGDLARWLPDGNIEFLGRMDHQVKIRGFRIELGEIEAVLRSHPAVRETVVTAREYQPGDQRLTAYLLTRSSQSLKISDLRQFLREKLPDFMMPADFVLLERLPLTPNGKIDRKALPAPHPAAADADGKALPASETEKIIAEIWEKALGIGGISKSDLFFDLGGHSLLAVQVIEQMERATGVRLTPRDILLQNLEQLAARCEPPAGHRRNTAANKSAPIDPSEGFFQKLKRIFGKRGEN